MPKQDLSALLSKAGAFDSRLAEPNIEPNIEPDSTSQEVKEVKRSSKKRAKKHKRGIPQQELLRKELRLRDDQWEMLNGFLTAVRACPDKRKLTADGERVTANTFVRIMLDILSMIESDLSSKLRTGDCESFSEDDLYDLVCEMIGDKLRHDQDS